MSPATVWTEASQAATGWIDGQTSVLDDGFALFGMPIPLSGAIAVLDPNTPWTEASQSATSWVEASQAATVWTEAT
jgi:hypothetical protein